MDNYKISWKNGCCEDTSNYNLYVYDTDGTLHYELTAEYKNDQIVVKLDEDPLVTD